MLYVAERPHWQGRPSKQRSCQRDAENNCSDDVPLGRGALPDDLRRHSCRVRSYPINTPLMLRLCGKCARRVYKQGAKARARLVWPPIKLEVFTLKGEYSARRDVDGKNVESPSSYLLEVSSNDESSHPESLDDLFHERS